jgi:hypothetical protein
MAVMSDENRRARIESALRSLDAASGDAERHRIPWKANHVVCPVVELSLDAVVLNPRSHRIRAQLKSHPMREDVNADPYGEDAQELVRWLLREDAGFEALRDNIREEGQRNPGVITRSGLLVNANRRAVALRDLDAGYIRVAVLPPEAGNQEIVELELRLQMTAELKRDYTFTNQLLFVDELRTEHSHTAATIAKLLRYAPSSDDKLLREGAARVERETRMLAMIEEIRSVTNGRLGYPHFDDQRQSMIELDEAFEKLRKEDPAAAEQLRTTRYIGIITASGYQILRRVDERFFDDYFLPALEDDVELNEVFPLADILQASGARREDDPALDLLDDGSREEDRDADPSAFLSWFASLEKHVERPVTGDATIKIGRGEIETRVRKSLESAAEQAKSDDKHERNVEAPVNRLAEAIAKVRKAKAQFREVAGNQDFDIKNFEYKLKKLEKSTEALRTDFEQLAP